MTALNTTDLRSKIVVPRNERLIVALDVADPAEARALVEQLGDSVQFYKVGMELFMAGGYFELIDWLGARGKKVFVDLKFFDVPETVRSAIRALAKRHVAFATIHGNQAIMEAAGKEKGNLKVLAVTALTSLDRGDLDDLGFQCDVAQLVLSRARRALEAGCDGIISSFTAVYGAFSIVPVFLLWLYLCWLMVLLGCVVTAELSDSPGRQHHVRRFLS